MQLVRVAVAVPLLQLFDYQLAKNIPIKSGMRVLVPFGNQTKVAIVVEKITKSELNSEQLKNIIQVLDQEPLFSEELWWLLNWASQYYHVALGEVLHQALPVKLRQGAAIQTQKNYAWQITAQGEEELRDKQLLRKSSKQYAALLTVQIKPLRKTETTYSKVVWQGLLSKNLVCEIEIPTIPELSWQAKLNNQVLVNLTNKLSLNKQQAIAVNQIVFGQGFVSWVLYGVTGSGKTEVYLHVIEEVLNRKQQVLVLVPEIGLTPQLIQRFQARFKIEIGLLHSNLNDSKRLDVWRRAKAGNCGIVIGTRSALFTQFDNLGLIILDEEHDLSYKQQDGWAYHARDLAVLRAKKNNIPIILGSATPSLESLYNVEQEKYQLLTLTERAENQYKIPQKVINLTQQKVQQGISNQLFTLIESHLKQGNQVLLFLNRRGYAPVVLCHECAWIAKCENCDKPFTCHQYKKILACHHCSQQRKIYTQCGACGSTNLVTTGIGTEQLENILADKFPSYPITRIDKDNIAGKGRLQSHLQDIEQGKSKILIGTQMLAKGHHFPNVTLVALVNIDGALFSLDYRAEERLAQLYMQVAGRAGRSHKQGEVVLQTHYPEHPFLKTLLQYGYMEFAKHILSQRKMAGLPPFSAQALFKIKHKNTDVAEKALQQINEVLAEIIRDYNIQGFNRLGPNLASHAKKAGQYRWLLLVQHESRAILQQVLALFAQRIAHIKLHGNAIYYLDVDPYDFN